MFLPQHDAIDVSKPDLQGLSPLQQSVAVNPSKHPRIDQASAFRVGELVLNSPTVSIRITASRSPKSSIQTGQRLKRKRSRSLGPTTGTTLPGSNRTSVLIWAISRDMIDSQRCWRPQRHPTRQQRNSPMRPQPSWQPSRPSPLATSDRSSGRKDKNLTRPSDPAVGS